MNIVALIPARAGSKRIPGKNIKLLGGKPLLAWTIRAAGAAGIFREIVVSTDSPHIFSYARENFNVRASMRPGPTADDAPDIQWVQHTLSMYRADDRPDAFAILRPTSPFRSPDAIQSAWATFKINQPADSLRAIKETPMHPGKMWRIAGARMHPLYPFDINGVPWHSCPTQTLPPVFIQTASLEIAWTATVLTQTSISGASIVPFTVLDWDAFDINTPEDWDRAERHVADLQAHPAAQ